jgi:hypothetical protein
MMKARMEGIAKNLAGLGLAPGEEAQILASEQHEVFIQ